VGKRRGYNTETFYTREEPHGFVTCEVDYEIQGTVTPGHRGSYEEPPEGPAVDVMEVVRINPFTAEKTSLPPSEWRFTDEEFEEITDALAKDFDHDEPERFEDYDD
jgi:hypothetical protein